LVATSAPSGVQVTISAAVSVVVVIRPPTPGVIRQRPPGMLIDPEARTQDTVASPFWSPAVGVVNRTATRGPENGADQFGSSEPIVPLAAAGGQVTVFAATRAPAKRRAVASTVVAK